MVNLFSVSVETVLSPLLTASAIQFAALIGISVLFTRRGASTYTVILFALACLPVPLLNIKGHWFLAGDLAGALLLMLAVVDPVNALPSKLYCPRVAILYLIGVVLWPLLSAWHATLALNETISRDPLLDFVFRSIVQLGFFVWAYRVGIRSRKPLQLLLVPVLLWVVFATAGILQFAGLLNVDAFWQINARYRDTRQGGLVSGFMGMDKPQLALWANYALVIALWVRSEKGMRWLLWLVLPLSVTTVLLIGSRQGLIALAFVLFVTLVIQWRVGQLTWLPQAVVASIICALLLPALFGAVGWAQLQRAVGKFEELRRVGSVQQLVDARDRTTRKLFSYILQNTQRLTVGSGIATESPPGGPPPDRGGGPRTYAEGEFLRLLWAGGLISVFFYLLILGMFLRNAARGLDLRAPASIQTVGGLLLTVTLTGILFCFGQFHMFTVNYQNVPCNYLLWIASGLLLGHVTAWRRSPLMPTAPPVYSLAAHRTHSLNAGLEPGITN